jgi:hypothetical protein
MAADERCLHAKGFRDFRRQVEQMNAARRNYLHSFLRDPLARLLIKTLRFSPWKGFSFSLGIVALSYILRAAIHFGQGGSPTVMGRAVIDCLYDLILVPVTVGVYIWLSARLPYVTFALSRNGVRWKPPDGESRYPAAELHRNILNRASVFLGALGIMAILLAIHLVPFREHHWLWSGHRGEWLVFFLVKFPFTWLVPWYMVAVVFIKQILFVLYFRRVFGLAGLKIDLEHPDRCGGLNIFIDYLLRFTYYLMLCASGIALLTLRSIRLGYFRRDFLLHALILGYIPVCLFFFYFPLHPLRMRIKGLLGDFRERIRENPRFYLGFVSPGMQRRFLMVVISPFVFFYLLGILL